MARQEADIPQAKFLRIFNLISLLKKEGRTIPDLAFEFDTSERTVYRYLKLLHEVGFCFEKDSIQRFKIVKNNSEPYILTDEL